MQELHIVALETVSGLEISMSLSEVTGPSGRDRQGTRSYRRTVPWSEVPDDEAGFPGWVSQVCARQAYRLRAG